MKKKTPIRKESYQFWITEIIAGIIMAAIIVTGIYAILLKAS